MNFLDDINNYITKEYGLGVADYRYVNISGKYVYVEGHSGISVLTDKEISFKIKKKIIKISGSDLIIKYFDISTAIVQGQIVNVVVL